jgi:hypothetical protein
MYQKIVHIRFLVKDSKLAAFWYHVFAMFPNEEERKRMGKPGRKAANLILTGAADGSR